MEPQRPSAPPPAPAPVATPAATSTPSPRPPIRAHWTPARQRIFLVALLDTGSVARAARAAGMSRSSAHRLRARLAGTPFDRSWDHALALHARRLADPFAPEALPPERQPQIQPQPQPQSQPQRPQSAGQAE